MSDIKLIYGPFEFVLDREFGIITIGKTEAPPWPLLGFYVEDADDLIRGLKQIKKKAKHIDER